jgi:uncharacterized protein (DUF1697 family)
LGSGLPGLLSFLTETHLSIKLEKGYNYPDLKEVGEAISDNACFIVWKTGENMNQYVCLLRGVNVGGKNMVTMKALKDLFEELGFVQVKTYINSGNILFQSDRTSASEIRTICQQAINVALGLDIDMLVVKAEELVAAIADAPTWWGEDPHSKHDAFFAIPPATSEAVIGAIGQIKSDYEKIAYSGPIIFWSAPLATFSRTRGSQLVKTQYYSSITIRNANTARKLALLAQKE